MLVKELIKKDNIMIKNQKYNIEKNDIKNVKILIDRSEDNEIGLMRHIKPIILIIEKENIETLEYACEDINYIIMIGPEVQSLGKDAFGANKAKLIIINNENEEVINQIFEDITIGDECKLMVVSDEKYEGIKRFLIHEASHNEDWHYFEQRVNQLINIILNIN